MILCSNPSAQYQSYKTEIDEAVLAVMRSNQYILGNQVFLLEQEFADYIGVLAAIGVANGTDAIELSLRALDIGVGDEVITVSHTAVATVAAVEAAGSSPVLVDVEPHFFTLNPFQLDEAITSRTKAVIAVHLYGHAANIEVIQAFCLKHNLFLIEDVSQAHGAKYNGKRLGSIGDIGCFSCYPTKNLGAMGDAGLITTNNKDLAKKIRMLREYGWNNRISEFSGRNSRLDEIQASILRVKLRYLDSNNEKRRQIAQFYKTNLIGSQIGLPKIRSKAESVFHLFVIEVNKRNQLMKYLSNEGIQAGIHYSLPIHMQPAYKDRIKIANDMSVTETLANRIISLPIYPELSMQDAEKISNNIKSFFE